MTMIASVIFAGGLSVQASADDSSWFWGRGMMGHWFRGEMMDRGMRDGWGLGMMGARMSAERLDALKAELKITEQQKKEWDDYASAINDATKAMRETHAKLLSGSDPTTLPERVTQYEAMMTSGFEAMQKVDTATLALYDALDTEQKKKADDLILGMGMM